MGDELLLAQETIEARRAVEKKGLGHFVTNKPVFMIDLVGLALLPCQVIRPDGRTRSVKAGSDVNLLQWGCDEGAYLCSSPTGDRSGYGTS